MSNDSKLITECKIPAVNEHPSDSSFNFSCHEMACQAPSWPQWFKDQKANAWKKYLALKQPSRHDESWRFANLKKADCSLFSVASSPNNTSAIITRSQGVAEFSAKLVFANNQLIHREVVELPKGVIFTSLEEALRDHEELVRNYFMKYEARLGSLKFAMLHQAQLQTGAFLYVPSGVFIEKPLECWHWVDGSLSAIFPHTLVICDEESQASLIDHFASVKNEPALICGVNDLFLKPNAQCHYASLQIASDEATVFHLNTTEVAAKGKATALQLNLGGSFVRTESDSRLVGEEANSIMLSMNLTQEHQEVDQRTFQDHIAPHATSDLLYHNVLNDQARTIFSGLIKVEPLAHETDAYQKVRNLMLSDEAEANSMPGLEILADNVRCTHGATSGELNKDELFYMMARGIAPQAAAKLIVRGFLQTVLERVEEPHLQKYLGSRLDRELGI